MLEVGSKLVGSEVTSFSSMKAWKNWQKLVTYCIGDQARRGKRPSKLVTIKLIQMSSNPQNEIIKSAKVLTNVPLPAKVKKLKLQPVQGFQVPTVELIYKTDPERSK